MSKQLPKELQDEFMGWMEVYDHDDLPDGAWFATLEQAAEFFIGKHQLKGLHENDLAHFYIQQKG